MICTDDGTYGHKGFVTDKLRETLEKDKDIKLAVCIGPVPMMKFCCKVTKEFGVKTLVSLNPIMVDGTGMCGCCRVRWAARCSSPAWTGRSSTAMPPISKS